MDELFEILRLFYPELEYQAIIDSEFGTDDIDERRGIVMSILPLWLTRLGIPVTMESHCNCVFCCIERFTEEGSLN